MTNRFGRPIDVLDLGCGTGRYFFALARRPRGSSASTHPPRCSSEAKRPPHEDLVRAESVTLVQGDLLTHTFGNDEFDLVYSIGVLAEHTPLTRDLVQRVHAGSGPAAASRSPRCTLIRRRSLAALRDVLRRRCSVDCPARSAHALHTRLMAGGMYADEAWVRDAAARQDSPSSRWNDSPPKCICTCRVVAREGDRVTRFAGERVLVIGGLGFIGTNLTARLLDEGAA